MDLALELMVYFLIAGSSVSAIRIVIGPSIVDRLIGFSMVSAQVLALLAVLSVQAGRAIYLDVALVYDIFGFIGLLTITRYFSTRREDL
ncbi:MAG: monovalent cation/H+ antiporter complex subunit F [Spirochaetaceae bacterium]|nr:monovalent cation/H+ antiporter complex subunit F [Spirochaetaceae bacterium]MDT8299529.1 monovalent cation/H+ antiporter complex subunit F [Spirochaetaceae bacterium]